MTKDEARESYLNARDRVFHGGLVGIELFRARQDEVKVADAYAQACVDAALADTLGMLEEIAKQGLGAVAYTEMHRIEVSIWPVDKRLHYQVGYRIEPAHMREVPRDEAEALLGEGKEG
jgi:hypothetical protein